PLVAELEHVSKSFGAQALVRDFSCRIQRGDRVGLIGPNGAGKTTLLKLILGELTPDSGNVNLGVNLTVAYFDQMRSVLDDNATLIDVINQGAEFVEIGNEKKHIISYLGDFLFAPERARAKVGTLSGGERNRLLLARLFTRPCNVLVLDEPTNDLDIETLELLEALLQEYDGTVFLVSHDRAFLDNVVTQVIAFEGDGKLTECAGGYEDWLRYLSARNQAAPSTAPTGRSAPAPRPQPRKKLSYNEARELTSLPTQIEALEKEQSDITQQLGDTALYSRDPGKAKTLQARYGAIEAELLTHLARWEALEARQSG
ncbi:MAG: ATP-binding cassette domain-containing protein, partial [Gammaproteobacteria bacterium]|nr:ATP-binding cassette domain-containing protein [Gammaproteobacteria bacterium]